MSDDAALEPSVSPVELSGPKVASDLSNDPDVVRLQLRATHGLVDLGDGVSYEGMTYDGQVPGPTISAKVGDELVVEFTNDLDEETTIHWHGLRISDQMDGNPRIQNPVQPGETFTYRFVLPEAGTYWYHPHTNSNEQMEKGLYGAIVVRDVDDPEYDLERVIVLDDILLERGVTMLPPFLARHPELMHGRYGNLLLTNGELSELSRASATQGDVERWRIVNTANARTMELSVRGAIWRVVAVDGGKLREPYTTDRLMVPVGQRYDVEVSYDEGGAAVELISHVLTLNEDGSDVVEVPSPVFRVDVAESADTPRVIDWPILPALESREADREVTLDLDAVADPATGTAWRINGQKFPHRPLFIFQQGETVRMRIVNMLGPEHPFHLHGQFFEVIEPGTVPGPQPGLKDTVLIPGLETVEVLAHMDNPGRWMIHCHILEHAQLGMMGEVIVEPR